jgi:hypothetical protein
MATQSSSSPSGSGSAVGAAFVAGHAGPLAWRRGLSLTVWRRIGALGVRSPPARRIQHADPNAVEHAVYIERVVQAHLSRLVPLAVPIRTTVGVIAAEAVTLTLDARHPRHAVALVPSARAAKDLVVRRREASEANHGAVDVTGLANIAVFIGDGIAGRWGSRHVLTTSPAPTWASRRPATAARGRAASPLRG